MENCTIMYDYRIYIQLCTTTNKKQALNDKYHRKIR